MRKAPRTIISIILAAVLLLGMIPHTAVMSHASAIDPAYAGHPRRPIEESTASAEILAVEAGDATAFGIDVSLWQGVIDWDTVQPQIDFAIIRCGYGGDETDQDDPKWQTNADACTRLGIPFGVYIYSYAKTDAQALSEAQHVLRLLEGYDPQLPIFLDLEDDSILSKCTKADILRHATIFCDTIEAAGYEAGIYANTSWWKDYLTADEYDQWYRWIARYASTPNYDKDFTIWQYSQTGTLDGIDEKVDLNYWYGEFPPNRHTHSHTAAVTTEATCTEDGILTYTCECGDSYDEPIPATGHTYESAATDPTCTEDGVLTYTCAACGDSYNEPIPATGHSYGSAVTTEATCSEDGVLTYTCDCGDTYTESIPATGHNYTSAVTAPTCTEAGFTTHTCTVCGDSYADDHTAPLGHSFSEGFCTVCGEEDPSYVAEVASGVSGGLTWKLMEDGVLTVSGEGSMMNYAGNAAMPWYGYADQITSVVLEAGITAIGDYAFYGMSALESITIPETVTAIGAYAFKNCPVLDDVVLPAGLTSLGESAFYACTGLTSIDIPASLWTVKPYTFKNCTALTEVTFHEGNLQKISDGAFYGTALTAVSFPDCLDIIDVYSFKNCTELASITLGSGITQIREAVFYGSAISSITIPEGVTTIKSYAFKNCVNLASVELPESLTTVNEAAFYACTALESLDLPDAVTTIGNYAFRKCAALTELSFGTGLVDIGESSFYGCAGLSRLDIPENVTTIQSYAFKGCTGLETVELPGSLVILGDSAFHTCTGLDTVTIPGNVTAVGEYCFSNSSITGITFLGNAPAIGTGAFNKLTATASYPGDNATWTADVMLSYGGTITWMAR